MNKITIVPADNIIIVNGELLSFEYEAPKGLRALHWVDTKGFIEWDSKPNQQLSNSDYTQYVEPFYKLWVKEKENVNEKNKKFEEEYNSLENIKLRKIIQIDEEISNNIIAGFNYVINGINYHFNYDSFDQQNFADTANMCQISLSNSSLTNIENMPTTVKWNSYLQDGTLVQQQFNAITFLDLYVNGAMKHKNTQMTIGRQKKSAVQAAQTKEELDAI